METLLFVCQTFLISSEVRILKIGIFFRELCPFLGTSDVFNKGGMYRREKQMGKISPFCGGDSDEICLDCCEEEMAVMWGSDCVLTLDWEKPGLAEWWAQHGEAWLCASFPSSKQVGSSGWLSGEWLLLVCYLLWMIPVFYKGEGYRWVTESLFY